MKRFVSREEREGKKQDPTYGPNDDGHRLGRTRFVCSRFAAISGVGVDVDVEVAAVDGVVLVMGCESEGGVLDDGGDGQG